MVTSKNLTKLVVLFTLVVVLALNLNSGADFTYRLGRSLVSAIAVKSMLGEEKNAKET